MRLAALARRAHGRQLLGARELALRLYSEGVLGPIQHTQCVEGRGQMDMGLAGLAQFHEQITHRFVSNLERGLEWD